MNAFILIDKSPGPSSFKVIQDLRRHSGIRKIGHAGTLDPFASGLLICALGQYTRLLSYIEAQAKTYEATLQLGISTSTGDPEGEITARQPLTDYQPEPGQLQDKALALKELQIPRHSAIKISGTRAYKYARSGVELEMPFRAVQIHSFQLLNSEQKDLIKYRVKVSKGTYIRAFSEWLAAQYQNLGHTVQLKRTGIGKLDLSKACPQENLADWRDYLIPPQALLGLPHFVANAPDAALLRHGNAIICPDALPHAEYAIYNEAGKLLAIALPQNGKLKPRLVFDPEEGLP